MSVEETKFIAFLGTLIILLGVSTLIFGVAKSAGYDVVPLDVTLMILSGIINIVVGGILAFTDAGT